MVAVGRKSASMAGTYICAGGDRRIADLNGFLGIKILESNLLLAVTNCQEHPTAGVLTQEVSRSDNSTHIATRMMESFIFPPQIVSEMNKADQRHHRTLTPHSLYTCIRVVLKLVNELNVDGVLGVAIAITNMNTAPNAGVVYLPLDKPPIILSLSPTQSNLHHEILLYRTKIPEENLHIRMNGRARCQYSCS